MQRLSEIYIGTEIYSELKTTETICFFCREMTFFVPVFIIVCVLRNGLFVNSDPSSKPYYTAAVFEHNRFGSMNDTADDIIQTNLEFYRKAAEVAKSKEVDIIVFPEYGIVYNTGNRTKVKQFLESIPDPALSFSNPCDKPRTFSKNSILHTLSCIAKNNSLYIVANMGDIQNCKEEHECPEDGVYHYNTNVVFDRNGKLILKYHKEHLCYEFDMNLPKEQQVPVFKTDFGNFATYTSFDIQFKRMSEVAQWPDIDGIMLPSMWVDVAPQFNSIQIYQSWALGNNCTLIGTNIQIPGYFAVGSGIFHHRKGALTYSYNPDGISKLVIARVPKRGFNIPANPKTIAITRHHSWDWDKNGHHMKIECSRQLLNDTEDIHNEYRCVEEDTSNYTFIKLTDRSAHLEVCSNGMCCSLDYTAQKLLETFLFGCLQWNCGYVQ
ncbi:unnamed protein product [Larinioides sclopetarius]|uniref:CN hydrolase domain-containing protein n=1 Tax=Larinioides sclopetarius TaxID=280406 RepID=A0AAV1ZRX6_9ARAC